MRNSSDQLIDTCKVFVTAIFAATCLFTANKTIQIVCHDPSYAVEQRIPTNSLRATRLRKTMQIAKFPNPKREAIIITEKGRYNFFKVLPKSDFLNNHCNASIEQVVSKKNTIEKLKIKCFKVIRVKRFKQDASVSSKNLHADMIRTSNS